MQQIKRRHTSDQARGRRVHCGCVQNTRSVESHDDTGQERCYYNDETEQEDWWTFENHATDFSFTAPAGRTFWISVTGAARDAGGRARALTVRFY